MRRIAYLLMAVAGVLTVCAGPAAAIPGEQLGCRVSPPGTGTFTAPECLTNVASGSYSLSFAVLGGSGTYGHSWNTNGRPPQSGCLATTNFCNLRTVAVGGDQFITVSVVITQAGQSATLSATAFVPAVCGQVLC